MKIRLGSSPSISSSIRRVDRASPRVVPGRVAKPTPPITPHYPPVHFFAESDVTAGGEATLKSEALSNRTGRGVEIHEIRLAAWLDPQTTIESIDLGGVLRLRLSVGEDKKAKILTNGFIPFWLLGKTEQEPSQVFIGGNAVAAGGASALYIWRLSRPWYIPPNVPVNAQLQHSGALRDTVRGMIGLAGRYVDVRSTSFVPYASAYVSKPFGYSDVDTDESNERDLVNITGRVLTVDRIIARVGVIKNVTASGTLIGSYLDRSDAAQVRMVNLRMFTSTNLPIIRDYSAPRAIFGYSRSLDSEHQLGVNDFYRVGVRKTAGEVVTPAFDTWSAQAQVSIVGCREEAV